jgi:hypothetical protein
MTETAKIQSPSQSALDISTGWEPIREKTGMVGWANAALKDADKRMATSMNGRAEIR